MKKLILLWGSFPLLVLWGCSIDFSTTTTFNVDALTESGTAFLSGARETTKGVANEYYQDQVKPIVDTTVDAASKELEKATQQAKDLYNKEVEKINEAIQSKADEAKDEVNKLKVN